MRRFFLLLCVACLCPMFFFAQEEKPDAKDTPPENEIASDATYVYKANQRGDQFIKLELMVDIPLRPNLDKLKVGGEGSLGYMHFLSSEIAIGGDISFGFNGTIGGNIFTFVPFMVKAMYQPTFRKFEFPISLGLGFALENYVNRVYFGFAIKPAVGVFFRMNADWSFGAHFGCYILPQTYKNPANNYTGIILDTGLSARYHF